MNQAPRKKAHVEEGESPIGFVMFGDLMSQLLCFFILLYVMASMNASKTEGNEYSDLVSKFSKSFKDAMEKKKSEPVVEKKVESQKEKLVTAVKKMMIDEKLEPYIDLIVEDKRIRIIFSQPVLFNSGDAIMKEEFSKMLSPVADVIAGISNNIVVEGHTDNVPIHNNRYESNWVLSFHRAYSVVNYFTGNKKIDPQRISVMGYGEYRPRFPNDSDSNRNINRRIEINIMTDSITEKETKPIETIAKSTE